MNDKRRSKRVNITMNLLVSSLFRQDNDNITVDSPIFVKDISKLGIGFISKSILPIGYYFNASISVGEDKSTLYCVVKIIRCEALEDNEFSYGCEFVGMAPVLDYIFDDIEKEYKTES